MSGANGEDEIVIEAGTAEDQGGFVTRIKALEKEMAAAKAASEKAEAEMREQIAVRKAEAAKEKAEAREREQDGRRQNSRTQRNLTARSDQKSVYLQADLLEDV